VRTEFCQAENDRELEQLSPEKSSRRRANHPSHSGGIRCCRSTTASISRLPDIEGDKPKRQRFKRYPIGFFHIDIAEVQTAEGKLYLFVGIDRTSKFAVTQLVDKAEAFSCFWAR
jgi:hypothetical protein